MAFSRHTLRFSLPSNCCLWSPLRPNKVPKYLSWVSFHRFHSFITLLRPLRVMDVLFFLFTLKSTVPSSQNMDHWSIGPAPRLARAVHHRSLRLRRLRSRREWCVSRTCSVALGLSSFDVKGEQLHLAAVKAVKMRLQSCLADQLVKGDYAEYCRFPHAGLDIIVSLK